ncbi:unnamed protein product [Cochlearia groenlandica]
MSLLKTISTKLNSPTNKSSATSPSHKTCNHLYARYGLCIACNSKVKKRQGRSFDYIVQGLQLSHEAVSLSKRFNTQHYCLNEKKLHLVLDLDHTLLHSKQIQRLSESEEYLIEEAGFDSKQDLWNLDDTHLLKLRPFVRTFLTEASKMFVMCVYTMGNGVYAKSVLDLIDPERLYFGERVITRDESPYEKTLGLVLAEERGVVIVDDTRDVWTKHKSNLVEVSRYNYFRVCDEESRAYSEEKIDESEDEGELVRVLKLLKEVHCGFFGVEEDELGFQDVRFLLQELDFKAAKEDSVFVFLDEN